MTQRAIGVDRSDGFQPEPKKVTSSTHLSQKNIDFEAVKPFLSAEDVDLFSEHSYQSIAQQDGLSNFFYRYIGLKNVENALEDVTKVQGAGTLQANYDTTMPDLISDTLLATRLTIGTFRSSVDSIIIATNFLGMSALLSSVIGCMLYERGQEEVTNASQGAIEDGTKKMSGQARQYRGVFQALGGVTIALSRATNIFISIQKITRENISKSVDILAPIFSSYSSIGGNSFFGLVFLFIGMCSTPYLAESFALSDRLGIGWLVSSSPESIARKLREERKVFPIGEAKALRDSFKEEEFKAILEREVDVVAVNFLHKLSAFTGKKIEPDHMDEMAATFLMSDNFHSLPQFSGDYAPINNMNELTPKQRLGLYLICEKKAEIQEKKLERCLGRNFLDTKLSDSSALPTVREITTALWMNRIVHVGVVLLGGIGVLVSATAVTAQMGVFTLPTFAGLALGAAISGLAFALDANGILDALQRADEVKKLEWVLNYSNLIVSIFVVVGILGVSQLTLGTAPLAVGLCAALLWVASSITSVVLLHMQQKRYRETSISVQELQEDLNKLRSRITSEKEYKKDYRKLLNKINLVLEKSYLTESGKKALRKIIEENQRERSEHSVEDKKWTIQKIQEKDIITIQMYLDEWEETQETLQQTLSNALRDLSAEIPKDTQETIVARNLFSQFASWCSNPFATPTTTPTAESV